MDKDFTCALCLQFETEYPNEDYFVSTECGHVYHYKCIKFSYDTGYKECPVDRNLIDITKLRRLYASELRSKQNFSTNSQASSAALLKNMTEAVEYNFKFKIAMVGDSGVGKSCLMQRYTDDVFSTTAPTIGCDWRTKSIDIGGKVISLSIWDTVGQEKYRSLISNYVRDTHGCLIVYDITNAETIEHIEDWYEYIKKFALCDTVAVLIGNKSDLEHRRQIPKDVGKKLGAKLNIPFFETSAKDTYNVDAAFRCIAANILDNRNLMSAVEQKMKNPNIKLDQSRNSESTMRHACSHSWHLTKAGITGAARRVRATFRSSNGN